MAKDFDLIIRSESYACVVKGLTPRACEWVLDKIEQYGVQDNAPNVPFMVFRKAGKPNVGPVTGCFDEDSDLHFG